MSAKRFWAGALSIGLLGTALGCAQGMPTTTTDRPGDRQVLSINDPGYLGDQAAFEQVRAQLPQRISEADAKGMLVQIDPSKVVEQGDKSYSVQRYRFFSRGFFPYYRGLYSSLYYYPFGNYYFPYTYRAGAYYPYSYRGLSSLYYPYFYRYRGLYSPYYYWY